MPRPSLTGRAAAAGTITTLVLAFGGAAAAQQPGMAQEMVDLSSLSPDQEVAALSYCDGTYRLATAAGEELEFLEFNLRFKTDASEMGPPDGTAAVLPSGMMGDRAFVIFAAPEAISAFIEHAC